MPQRSTLQLAPPFELATQKGDLRSLQQFLQNGPVILTFHRGTW